MTPSQLRKLMKAAGLTVRGTAAELGMTQRQVFRYRAGEAEIPRVVELALKWVAQHRKKSQLRFGRRPPG